jgi:ankyrin repeat protein
MNLLIKHGAKINGAHHPLKWVCSNKRALALVEQGCWINSELKDEKNIFDAIGRFEVAEFSDLKMADLFHAIVVRGVLKVPDWSDEEKARRVDFALTMDRLIKKLQQTGSKDLVSRIFKFLPPSTDICSVTVLAALGNEITNEQREFVCGQDPFEHYSNSSKPLESQRLSIAVLKRVIERISVEKDMFRKKMVDGLTAYRARIMKSWLNGQMTMLHYYPYHHRPSGNGPFIVTVAAFISNEMKKKKIFGLVPDECDGVRLGEDFFGGVREHYFRSLGMEVERGDKLFQAIKEGNYKRVTELIDFGVSPNAKDKHGCTALMMAAASGHYEMCRYLMYSGADLRAKSDIGWTALMDALNSGNKEICKLLCHMSRMYEKNNLGGTALMMAAFMDDLEIFKFFLEDIARYGRRDAAFYSGCNAVLARAAIFGKITVCKLLIDAMVTQMKRGGTEILEPEKQKLFDRIHAIGHQKNRKVLEEYALRQFDVDTQTNQ